MQISQLFLIAILTATTITSLLPAARAEFVCPEAIWPCSCSLFDGGHLECVLSGVITQGVIDTALIKAREANNLTSTDDWLELDTFLVQYTNLTELDLTFLSKVRLNKLYIQYNMQLTTLRGPPMNDSIGMTDVNYIAMNNNMLTDAGLGDSLKYFLAPSVHQLDLARNTLMGAVETGEEFQEFLPGLSSFKNLQVLRLEENFIQRIRRGQFKSNNRLKDLSLYWNQILEIEENAFIFDETPVDMLNQSLWVDLHLNHRLSESTIHENHGLDLLNRTVTFYLDYLNLQTLPQATFEKFLDAQPGNLLKVGMTHINCDGRVKWLKDRKEEFQNFVQYATCVNDPGFDVFTSNLVN